MTLYAPTLSPLSQNEAYIPAGSTVPRKHPDDDDVAEDSAEGDDGHEDTSQVVPCVRDNGKVAPVRVYEYVVSVKDVGGDVNGDACRY
ncbi:hypothetical protein DPMN_033181 [Dreissena polymorpha]|uniref:Uncharacterized protein n=1 Tax=Dreissena polymorpha TaxID=45954 RepID=A0A9D4M5F6_DREPO|nr:hypothetical protein DPMN_033181 [Dreissena polymorpha]